MTRNLDLEDIQGNVVRAYGRYSYPFARYFFLHISDPVKGRAFVNEVRNRVITAARWPNKESKPQCTINIGFTAHGLGKLQVPGRTLQGMPDEFLAGMKARAFLLGDRDPTKTQDEDPDWDKHWDQIWRDNRAPGGKESNNVHIWISLNAQLKTPGTNIPCPELEEKTKWIRAKCKVSKGGVRILTTNGQNGDQEYQSASAVFTKMGGMILPTPKEHLGFTDGISDPVFEGQYEPDVEAEKVIGRGKRMGSKNGWEPLKTGEFILGHPDESQELPPCAKPPEFSNNGTFMVYRKLHENVESFESVLKKQAKIYAKDRGVSLKEADETLRAKMCGRWTDGVSLMVAPTHVDWMKFRKDRGFDDPDPMKAMKNLMDYLGSSEASDFRYGDDMRGYKCPVGAHTRRVNPRDYLDPVNKVGTDPKTGEEYENLESTTALNKRRRILRRGLPYGAPDFEHKDDSTEQGVAMMMIGASPFRQFEFVQQQWIQYGLDFHQGNNTCPMLGGHENHKRYTINSDPKSGEPPFIMDGLKTFVECRGGDYFFIPSLTALRMIAMGVVDPT